MVTERGQRNTEGPVSQAGMRRAVPGVGAWDQGVQVGRAPPCLRPTHPASSLLRSRWGPGRAAKTFRMPLKCRECGEALAPHPPRPPPWLPGALCLPGAGDLEATCEAHCAQGRNQHSAFQEEGRARSQVDTSPQGPPDSKDPQGAAPLCQLRVQAGPASLTPRWDRQSRKEGHRTPGRKLPIPTTGPDPDGGQTLLSWGPESGPSLSPAAPVYITTRSAFAWETGAHGHTNKALLTTGGGGPGRWRSPGGPVRAGCSVLRPHLPGPVSAVASSEGGVSGHRATAVTSTSPRGPESHAGARSRPGRLAPQQAHPFPSQQPGCPEFLNRSHRKLGKQPQSRRPGRGAGGQRAVPTQGSMSPALGGPAARSARSGLPVAPRPSRCPRTNSAASDPKGPPPQPR